MTAATAADLQKKFKYHHGNLRDVLLEAAEGILKTKGIEDLSLRNLAKATGVTQAAPYSHFRDKDELLAAVAERGFQRLALQMAEQATGTITTQARLEKLVTAYIRFACDNSPLFRLMFGAPLADLKRFPTLAMTAGKSYALISTALAQRVAPAVETSFLTVTVWSLCHGLATLVMEGLLKTETFGTPDLETFVAKAVAVFGQHLD